MPRIPKISVCIPCRNHGGFLKAALDSVLGQTEQDFEVIVWDDASRDAMATVMASFEDSRIRSFRSERRRGVASSRNACLEKARGRYIAWLDADDVYLPGMLAAQSAVLDENPRVGLVHGAFELIDAQGRSLRAWAPPFGASRIEDGEEAFAELVLSNYIVAPTVLVRRACHDRVGPYSPRIGPSSTDWEMWLRIALHADLAFNHEVVARYRLHGESITARTTRGTARLRCDARVVRALFRHHGSRLPNPQALQARARAALAVRALNHAWDALVGGRRLVALRDLALAFRAVPALLAGADAWRLGAAYLTGREYPAHRHARSVLARLLERLEGTRLGESHRPRAVADADWEKDLALAAEEMRRVIPDGCRVLVIDKQDPTLLHLSRRPGGHFPDLRFLPDGYPRDSAVAIGHLEELRSRGADYFVVPRQASWWLDHYRDFGVHLATKYRRAGGDRGCVIYRLSP